MSDFAIGDMAQLFQLKRQNGQVKQDLARLTEEMTSGLTADTVKHLTGDLAPLASLQSSLAELEGYAAINAEAAMSAEALQAALALIDSQAAQSAMGLMSAGTGGAAAQPSTVGFDTEQAFRSAMSALNARWGDRSLMAGQATDGAAVADADTVLADLVTLTAGMQTVQDIADALDGYFADGGTFDTVIYQGGPALAPMQVAPDEKTQLDIRANDPALRQTLKGLAMGALLAQGALASNTQAQLDLALRAGQSLMASQTERAALSAHLGLIQARIADADTRNQAQITGLRIAVTETLAVDPYETATKLQAVQTQLELLYTITARMARLSLADYL